VNELKVRQIFYHILSFYGDQTVKAELLRINKAKKLSFVIVRCDQKWLSNHYKRLAMPELSI
jgi:hypothetical protein